MPDPISRSDLEARLESPILAEQALRDYFELKEVGPFRFEYRLRDDAPITDRPPDDVLGGVLGAAMLKLANRVARDSRRRRYESRKRKAPDVVRMVSEGDSWFQHPLLIDLIDHLGDHYNILSLGGAGDELSDMVSQAEYRAALAAEGSKVLLWSGGGNDMLGDHFGDYLSDPTPPVGSPPPSFLNARFDEALNQVLSLYETVVEDLAQILPTVTLVTHGYDRVIPKRDGHGGKWVGPPMEKAGIQLATDGRRVIAHILEQFDARMRALADGHGNMVHVSTQAIVPDGEWDDEIHPTSAGFGLVAERIRTELAGLTT